MVSGTFTRCSLWPMGYKVCSRLLVLFSYSVEVLGGLCLFVYFDYSARILSHDSFTKRVLSRQFFLLSLLDRLEDVCFVPLECRWRQSKGTSTANILNCGAFCPLSAAGVLQGHFSGNKALKSLRPHKPRGVSILLKAPQVT